MKIALDPTPFHHDYELLDFPLWWPNSATSTCS